ncbi:glycosyltransferase [uncultured Methanobrevibacter sp.]|uniref:glycosyltransferase n=1 Tax=uncultured Methanobrevibacter sp. TaxID=253161 RepID=UPI00260BE1C7|nr:glycosyltransferase [uncultured Methanobrevibacter sp.]
MNLSRLIKKNPLAYIAMKSKTSPNKISLYKKIYLRIKKLDLIDKDKYLAVHEDCKTQDMDVNLHYLYYGVKDELNIQQSYITEVFNLDFYKRQYNVDNPVFDYVLNGFFKNNQINVFDNNYINTLEMPLFKQYYQGQNNKLIEEVKDNSYITDKRTLIPYIQLENPIKTDKIRVGVFTNDSFENLAPCPYIRLHAPFNQLSKSDKYTFFMYGMDSYVMMNIDNILRSRLFDIVVVQRILPFLDLLLARCKKHGIKIIYETDDDLLGVEKNSPSFEYVDRVRNQITNFIDGADVITVTTPNLASKFDSNKTEIIHNYYVNTVFDVKKDIKHEGKLKLGYYGTLTHSKDLFLIKDVILNLKEKYDFDFEVIGGFNAEDNVSEDWYESIELPPNNMSFEVFMPWLSKVANWDIALVPLENSKFNLGKSELKYIELSVLGIPGVYSDMPVYNSVIKNGVNGLLAKDETQWILNIEKLISDVNLRQFICKNALDDVLENYSLDDVVNKWNELFSKLI